MNGQLYFFSCILDGNRRISKFSQQPKHIMSGTPSTDTDKSQNQVNCWSEGEATPFRLWIGSANEARGDTLHGSANDNQQGQFGTREFSQNSNQESPWSRRQCRQPFRGNFDNYFYLAEIVVSGVVQVMVAG